ncbi:unnamed protein product, partial [Scytosiphon promiscuus]
SSSSSSRGTGRCLPTATPGGTIELAPPRKQRRRRPSVGGRGRTGRCERGCSPCPRRLSRRNSGPPLLVRLAPRARRRAVLERAGPQGGVQQPRPPRVATVDERGRVEFELSPSSRAGQEAQRGIERGPGGGG